MIAAAAGAFVFIPVLAFCPCQYHSCVRSEAAAAAQVRHILPYPQPASAATGRSSTLNASKKNAYEDGNTNNLGTENERKSEEKEPQQQDTIRVRIWQALSSGQELSLTQLSKAVGERRRGELRSHLTHVEKQAKTLRNKSDKWRVRRGLPPASSGSSKIRLKMRKGSKNEVFVRLEL